MTTTTETAATTETPAAVVETATPAPNGESLLNTANIEKEVEASIQNDWLPEKFQVKDADGNLDEAASARKLAESYVALEKHKGALSQAPATPDDYKIDPPKDADGNAIEGVDMEQFTSDPLFKSIAAKAHAANVTNEQLQLFVSEYLALVPQLVQANQQLTIEEASAELSAVWADKATFDQNLANAAKAVQGFGAEADDVPGSRARLDKKFGNDPDFMALMATIGAEMREDKLPSSGAMTSQVDVESLMKSEAYWQKNHPDHARIKAQVDAYHVRKHGTAQRGRARG